MSQEPKQEDMVACTERFIHFSLYQMFVRILLKEKRSLRLLLQIYFYLTPNNLTDFEESLPTSGQIIQQQKIEKKKKKKHPQTFN